MPRVKPSWCRSHALKGGVQEYCLPGGLPLPPPPTLPSDTPLTPTERGRQGVWIAGTTQRPRDRLRRGFAFASNTDERPRGSSTDSNAKRTDAIGGRTPSRGKSSGDTITRRPDTNSTTTKPERDARLRGFIPKASEEARPSASRGRWGQLPEGFTLTSPKTHRHRWIYTIHESEHNRLSCHPRW